MSFLDLRCRRVGVREISTLFALDCFECEVKVIYHRASLLRLRSWCAGIRIKYVCLVHIVVLTIVVIEPETASKRRLFERLHCVDINDVVVIKRIVLQSDERKYKDRVCVCVCVCVCECVCVYVCVRVVEIIE